MQGGVPVEAHTLGQANALVRYWAHSAPDNRACDKTRLCVTFADGGE